LQQPPQEAALLNGPVQPAINYKYKNHTHHTNNILSLKHQTTAIPYKAAIMVLEQIERRVKTMKSEKPTILSVALLTPYSSR